MALAQELYGVPASRLDSFVAQWLQPSRGWKEEVLEAVRMVEQFLRRERFQGQAGLAQAVQVLKVVKVGSFGNGTVLRGEADVELVVFLSCFHSFREEARYHQAVLRLIWEKVWHCQDLLDLGLDDLIMTQGSPNALTFTIQTRETGEPINVTIVPAYRALGALSSQPPPEVYVSLIEACGYPGNFSPSFSELQRHFVKHRPTKVKSLLRLLKHWYQQVLHVASLVLNYAFKSSSCLSLPSSCDHKYVKAKSPRANLPPLYALELLAIYAWEMGTQESENFRLDEGLTTVMELLQEYEFICIYWTTYYTLENPVIRDFVRKQLKKERPIVLDPADPTHNVAEGYRWDIVAQRASQCLKQDCCYDNREIPVSSWTVKRARNIQLTVEQWGRSDLMLWANPYESIKKVKETIRQSRGSSGLQRLSFQEPGGERQLLRSHCSWADYGIFSDSRICLLDTVSPEIQVFVKILGGGSYAYAVHPAHFVRSLKEQIEDRQGLHREQQRLEFRGHVLQDWFDLGYYGIQDSDTVILSEKKAGEAVFPHC